MSHSQRDSDIWKLRQLSQAMHVQFPQPCSAEEVNRIMQSPAYVELKSEFDRIFSKYGFNPNIFKDNERAGSKRSVTRKIKTSLKRTKKHSEKQSFNAEISAELGDTDGA
jgi:hypothetical protein